MERKRFQAFFSKKAGFQPEIAITRRVQGGYEVRTGKLLLRAFSTEEGSRQVKIMLDFVEVSNLSRQIKALVKSKEKANVKAILHITERNGEESRASITLDRFQPGKLGVVFQRDNTVINVVLSDAEALAFADLLKDIVFPLIVEEEVERIEEGEVEEEAEETFEEAPFVDDED